MKDPVLSQNRLHLASSVGQFPGLNCISQPCIRSTYIYEVDKVRLYGYSYDAMTK